MRVLVACEFSGVVREAFRKRGHDAWSCDLLPCDDNSPYHIQGDVVRELEKGWDLMRCSIPKIAIENPIMHKYAKDDIGQQSQIIHPWQFGHGESKATCLWLKYLPPLKPTKIVEGREQRLHRLPPSADRGKLRSITYQGIANAMAQQWGVP